MEFQFQIAGMIFNSTVIEKYDDMIRISNSFDGCQSFRFIAESAGDAKTWDELQNAYILRTIDSREDNKSYALIAQSRFSDRPWLCKL